MRFFIVSLFVETSSYKLGKIVAFMKKIHKIALGIGLGVALAYLYKHKGKLTCSLNSVQEGVYETDEGEFIEVTDKARNKNTGEELIIYKELNPDLSSKKRRPLQAADKKEFLKKKESLHYKGSRDELEK